MIVPSTKQMIRIYQREMSRMTGHDIAIKYNTIKSKNRYGIATCIDKTDGVVLWTNVYGGTVVDAYIQWCEDNGFVAF
jgi:hypothetical protein